MEGHFYIAGKKFHNLPPLRSGSKYRIVITKPVELVWNLDTAKVKLPSLYHEYKSPSHFEPVEPTESNMSILVTGLPPEGEIGIVAERGICIGAAAFSNQEWVGVAAWGNNPNSEEIDGGIRGELFHLVLTDSSGEHRISYEILDGDAIFEPDGLAVFKVVDDYNLESEYGLSMLYPNPFCAVTLIDINLKNICEIDLAIYDQNGKRLSDIASGLMKPGKHTFSPGDSRLSSGLYTVRLKYGNYVSTRKMMLVK
ncbi:MAG: T9SS type A sorting domain-containing protein [Calditrichaeota bacterium]|nr:T9SS type A sorting domain-containing protein [Calditrichota bacterium]MBT7616089.1 T9SS type A sorting domain-containing protein [Calditrichota bacterium]MBT7790817.1 T9SS type A sorting domain-containing protein [Calditrichota bacterium]